MSNLNVEALKQLFPKNSKGKNHVDGANRVRVQVLLPPDTKARLDELVGTDSDARSAAVALGVEVLCILLNDEAKPEEGWAMIDNLYQVAGPNLVDSGFAWFAEMSDGSQP